MDPVIQIAGVIDKEEPDLLCKAGLTHIGFLLRLPDGRKDPTLVTKFISEAESALRFIEAGVA